MCVSPLQLRVPEEILQRLDNESSYPQIYGDTADHALNRPDGANLGSDLPRIQNPVFTHSMTRPLRIELAGRLYHLTFRTDCREAIFFSDDDQDRWLLVLAEVCRRFNWHCHAWCQMTNHYHVAVETPEVNLSRGMRQLNAIVYAICKSVAAACRPSVAGTVSSDPGGEGHVSTRVGPLCRVDSGACGISPRSGGLDMEQLLGQDRGGNP